MRYGSGACCGARAAGGAPRVWKPQGDGDMPNSAETESGVPSGAAPLPPAPEEPAFEPKTPPGGPSGCDGAPHVVSVAGE